MDNFEKVKNRYDFVWGYKPKAGGNFDDFVEERKRIEKYGNAFDNRRITLDEVEFLLKKYHFAPMHELYESSNLARAELLTEESIQRILDYHIADNDRAFIVISAQRGSWTDDIPEERDVYGLSKDLLMELSKKYKFDILPYEEEGYIDQLKRQYKSLIGKYGHNDPILLKITKKLQKDKEYNNKKTNRLKKDLAESPFSYKPTYGGFVENKGTPSEQLSFETSFMVFNIRSHEKHELLPYRQLFDWGVKMIQSDRYNQDCFLYKRGGHNPYYIDKSGKINDKYFFTGEYQIDNYAANYFTQLKKFTPQKDDKGNYFDKYGGQNKRITYKTKQDESRIFIGFFENSYNFSTIDERRLRIGGGELCDLDDIYGVVSESM